MRVHDACAFESCMSYAEKASLHNLKKKPCDRENVKNNLSFISEFPHKNIRGFGYS